MKVYISGALSSSSNLRSARDKYGKAADLLTQSGVDAYLPHTETDPISSPGTTPLDVFHTDVNALMASDAILAFLDEPSLGVGAEIAIALANGLAVVGACHMSVDASRFVIGLLEQAAPQAVIVRYETLADLVAQALVFARSRPTLSDRELLDAE